MREALAVPSKDLQQTIGEQFGIEVKQLDFVPIGESSWLYKATDTEGQLLAVKVQYDHNPAVDEARRRLAESGYPYIPKLRLTKDGKVQATMGKLHVSIEEYIEHDNVNAHDATRDQSYLVTLGKALRSLHNVEVSPADNNGPIPVETFQSVFLAPARKSIAAFTKWSDSKPEAQAIMNMLASKADTIKALFARSTELGVKLAAKQPKLMLTHGDVHFGNILETRDGGFYIIDWDWAMIGGAGHDLMYFSDAQLADISLGYGSDLLADQNNLQYYRNHLMLRFVWFWLNKAMTATSDKDLGAASDAITTTFDDSDYLLRALGAGYELYT